MLTEKVAWLNVLSIISIMQIQWFQDIQPETHIVTPTFLTSTSNSSMSRSCCFLLSIWAHPLFRWTFRCGCWWPLHWSLAFLHCSSHVVMAMPLHDLHARRSVVTLRLRNYCWKPLENVKRWVSLVVVVRLGPSLAEIHEMFIDNWQKQHI